jgi:hypothetical protein
MFLLNYAFEVSDITPFLMVIALIKLKNNLQKF